MNRAGEYWPPNCIATDILPRSSIPENPGRAKENRRFLAGYAGEG